MSEPEQTEEREIPRGVLSRTIKVQLALFVVITLAGLAYVGANYVGFTRHLFDSAGCTVHVELPDSGGIFSSAEVTYRGVTVGRVGDLRLIDNGVQADLQLNNCSNPKIPANSAAIVSDRSVIGEQYVNLVPSSGSGPYLSEGETIPMSHTKVPVSAQQLLTNIDALINSVDVPALRTAITELGAAFANRGQDLGTLLDASHAFLTSAQQNLSQTLALLRTSATVLSTQLAEGDALAGFTHGLNLLSGQLKASDPDLRTLLDDAPADLGVVRDFIRDNGTDLGAVIANLAVTGETLVRHVDGLEQILEFYPRMVGGGLTAMKPDGTEALGLILNVDDPPDCGDPKQGRQGYDATVIRPPSDTAPQRPNVAAHCTAPASSGVNVRGSANVPGGDPISASGGDVAYPRVSTSNTQDAIQLGTSLNDAGLVGDRSWLAILTTALG